MSSYHRTKKYRELKRRKILVSSSSSSSSFDADDSLQLSLSDHFQTATSISQQPFNINNISSDNSENSSTTNIVDLDDNYVNSDTNSDGSEYTTINNKKEIPQSLPTFHDKLRKLLLGKR
ncbi:hypothetical protein PV326_001522 [Microctonus aethiopoides]|nr:hypothetical protein PV326_001522 [Microctonus aethiopoides]